MEALAESGNTDFAVFIRSRRKSLGLTQAGLAARLDKDASSVCLLETGRAPVHVLAGFVRLATVLEVSLQELLEPLGIDVHARPRSRRTKKPLKSRSSGAVAGNKSAAGRATSALSGNKNANGSKHTVSRAAPNTCPK